METLKRRGVATPRPPRGISSQWVQWIALRMSVPDPLDQRRQGRGPEIMGGPGLRDFTFGVPNRKSAVVRIKVHVMHSSILRIAI